ncbi:hypothetical protein [Carboxylicivirga sp. N1Y90]|uniref:hypothetical protein n=1 Tax=Carboxylicivirga fragile TaxID=3417571 RepID=UPI003D346687|nr:hypothetical protein [Marinilabiliaceae bacterium N1Y90]
MKQLLTLHILLILSLTTFSQNDLRNGKIITNEGDTISGQLNYVGDINCFHKIQFITTEIDTTFLPFDILGYQFENAEYYVSKIAIYLNDTAKIFAEYLVKGEKDLFFHRSYTGFHYSISISPNEIERIPYENEVVTIDGVKYQKESKRHIGYLISYFRDCPELFPEIEKLKKPNRKSLTSITKTYHDITCGEGTCVIYEKAKDPIKIAIEPTYTYYFRNIFENGGSTSAYGALIYFQISKASERIYLKTGLIHAKVWDHRHNQIPFQFEYSFPNKILTPKFGIGVNCHYLNNGDVALTALVNAGCRIKLSNKLFLNTELSSDLFPLVYDKELMRTTFAIQTGLHIKLN